MKWLTTVGCLIGLLAIADGIEAQTTQRDWVMVRICQSGKTYALNRSADGTSRTRPLEETIRLNLREGEVARIEVADPQPLLFGYRSGAIEQTPSANYEALRQFGGALRALAQDSSGLDEQQPPSSDRRGTLVWDIQTAVEELYTRVERIPELIRQSAAPSADCTSENSARSAVKEEVAAWEIGNLATRITRHYQALHALALEMLRALPEAVEEQAETNEEPTPGGDVAELSYLLLALDLESAVRGTLEEVETFVGDVGRIDVREQVVEDLEFDPRVRQTVKVAIDIVGRNAEHAKRANRWTDTITFIVEPYSAVEFRLGAGAVWTNVGTVSYEAVEGDAGVVIEESREYSDVAAMLNIMPRVFRSPLVSGAIQVGATGVDHNAVVLVGFGVIMRGAGLSLSGGYAFGWGKKLDGQEVGDVIGSADGIATRRAFRQGGYVSLNVSF